MMQKTHKITPPESSAVTRVLETLKFDHELIRRFCRGVRRVYRRPSVAAVELAPLVHEFVHDFIDGFHHAREENVVFRGLDAVGGALEKRWDAITAQRRSIRDRLEGMRAALSGDDRGSRTLFAWNALAIAELLEGHVSEEERHLHPHWLAHRNAKRDDGMFGRLSPEAPATTAAYTQAEHVLLRLESIA